MSILMTEYDYATDLAVQREESYEDGYDEGVSVGLECGRLEGLERGAYETKLETAKSFLAEGLHPEIVARCTSLSLETVLELAQTK